MREMTIEEKLTVIREALENGAKVHLGFHGVPQPKAKEIIERMAELTGSKARHAESIQTYNFELLSSPFGLEASAYYENSKEEYKENVLKQLGYLVDDVDLSGSEHVG